MSKTALVLEGGGLRGIFSSGVVDCLIDQGIVLDYAVGVSAGACNTFAYVASRRGYGKACMSVGTGMDSYYGFPQVISSHRLVDLDKIFYEYTEKFHFSFEDFMNSPIRWEVVLSNLRTGQAEYHTTRDIERARLLGKASCSIPAMTSPVEIDGELYLDGGICDSIPLQHALDMGYDKVVVVLTRKKGNYSKVSDASLMLFKRLYGAYPNFLEAAKRRGDMYKEQVALCEQLEKEGKIILIRPTMQEVGRLESDENKLSMFYYHGYTKAKEYVAQIREW